MGRHSLESIKMGQRMFLVLAVTLVYQVLVTDASCFGRDASWKTGGKPVVSQPSRNDPTKVMLNWANIINNQKCVDKLHIHVLTDGLPKTSATVINVDKTLTSSIVDVDACVGYKFWMELEEKETFSNRKPSSEAAFKTTAIPTIPSRLDVSKFKVGYHWDPVKQISNLRIASIKFPKSLISHANCLDYIQVTGSEKPSLSRQSSTSSMTGALNWGHLAYNPQISVGSASTLPARTSGYGSSSSRGASPPRGPLAKTYSGSSSISRQSSTGSVLSTGSASIPYASPFGPVEKPQYANSLPRARKTGALTKSGPVKVQPPFLLKDIELTIAAKDCSEFQFEVKFFAPRSKEVGKVSVHLPALADIPDYVPPPITAVMDIKFGTSNKPIYGVKTASGVSAACLPSYFEALDAYRQRLENEITYQTKSSLKSQSVVTSIGNKVKTTEQSLDKSLEKVLAKQGCICTAPNIKFSTKDTKMAGNKLYVDYFGDYHYKEQYEGHPYYVKETGKPIFLFFSPKTKQWAFGTSLGTVGSFASSKGNLGKCP